MTSSWWTSLWQRLFKGSEPQPSEQSPQEAERETRPLMRETTPVHLAAYLPQLAVGTALSPGRYRPNNEDALLAWTFQLGWENQTYWGGLFIVADGMGGHAYGEKASRIAISVFYHEILHHLLAPWIQHPEHPPEGIVEAMEAALQKAHQAVRAEAPGGGTTFTAALVWQHHLFLIHVGDSRAYLLSPEGELTLLTEDHSLAGRLSQEHHIPLEEFRNHPQRHMLYQALGQPVSLEPQISFEHRLLPGWTLLLCSDGLWDELSNEEMARVLQAYRVHPIQAAQMLVREAEQAGGRDNISVIVVYHPESMHSESTS